MKRTNLRDLRLNGYRDCDIDDPGLWPIAQAILTLAALLSVPAFGTLLVAPNLYGAIFFGVSAVVVTVAYVAHDPDWYLDELPCRLSDWLTGGSK